MRTGPQWLRTRSLAIAIAGGLLAVSFVPALADNTRHHLAIGLGYYELTSDQLHLHAFTLTGDDLGDIDLRTAGFGLVRYGYSLSKRVDLTFEGRGTLHKDSVPTIPSESSLKTWWIGPGVRVHFANEGFRPYAQASLYSVHEELKFGNDPATSGSSIGFGVFAGADVTATDMLSVPMEIGYTYGQPEHDVSGIGGSVGLAFNFGVLP